jgi:acyl-coenzyme A thioesterase PaaI-like protein
LDAQAKQEEHTLSTQYWIIGASGDWSTAADWQSGAVPTSTDDAVINNSSLVTVNGTAVAHSLTLDNSTLTVSGTLTLGASLTVDGDSSLTLSGGTLSAPSITSDNYGYLYGYGTVSGAVSGDVGIYADGGTLKIQGSLAGDYGPIYIQTATLELSNGTSQGVDFLGTSSTLKLDTPAAFTGPIYNIALSDTIDLAGITASSASYSGTTLTINETNGQQLTYDNVSGSVAGDILTVASDNNGGTNVSWVAPAESWNPGASGDWSTAADWQSGAVPTSTDDAVINNSSLVTVNGTAVAHSLTLDNSTLTVSGTLTLGASLTVDGDSSLTLSGGTLSAPSITSDNYGYLYGYGTVSGAVSGDVGIYADGGTLKIQGSLADYQGSIAIFSGSTLELSSGTSAAVNFDNNAATLKLDAPTAFTGSLTNIVGGDTIDLAGITASSASYNNGTLTINETNGQQLTYSVNSISVSGDTLTVASDNNGGTDVFWTQTAPVGQPTITGALANQTVNDNASIDPFAAISIIDPNAGQTETLTVTFSNAANGSLSDPSALTDGSTFNNGVYTVVGTAAAVTVDLDALVFTPTNNQAAPVTTGFTVAVADSAGQTASNSTTSVVTTAVATTPTITGTLADQTVSDNARIDPFAAVSITDSNAGQTETLTVTLSSSANGALSDPNALTDGSTFKNGVYTVTGTAAAVTADLDALAFIPTDHQVAPGGAVTTGFTVAVTDSAGQTASNSTTSVVTTAVATTPTITGTLADQTVSDNARIDPFAAVSITDSNAGQTETLTVTLSSSANGALSDPNALTDGSTFKNGVYTVTGTAAAVTADLDALAFIPTDHQVAPGGAVTTGFTVAVTDSAGQTASNSTTSVVTTAVATTPTITGTLADQTVSDNARIDPFAAVSITDSNAGQTETLTVTLSSSANGALSDPNALTDGSTFKNGVYTVTGTAAAVTADLDALAFIPTDHQVAPGGAVTTGFTVAVTDSAGQTASNSTTSVVTTAVATTPTITGTLADQTVSDNARIDPFAAVSITDSNAGQTETLTVTLSSSANGALSDPNALTDGSTFKNGVYTVTGTAAAVTADLDALAFIPTDHQVAPGGTVTTGFTVVVTDSAGQTASNSTTSVVTTAVATSSSVVTANPDTAHAVGVRIPTKSPGYNGMMSPGIPE